MSSRVPATDDAARIGTSTFTNQPEVNSSNQIAALKLGSAKSVLLTLNNDLTVSGNINGYWQSNSSHIIDVNTNDLTISNNLILSDGTTGNDISLDVSTGSITVGNNLIQKANSSIVFTDAGNLDIYRNYNYQDGVYTAATSTINYLGTHVQDIAPLTYNDLIINKAGGKGLIKETTKITGDLSIQGACTIVLPDSVDVEGDISIASSCILDGNASKVTIAGDWLNDGTFLSKNSTVEFDGTTDQNIDASIFGNFVINKSSGTVTLNGDLTIDGDVEVLQSSLDMTTHYLVRSTEGGNFVLGDNTFLKIGGEDNCPRNFTGCSISTTSTVEYYANTTQQINAKGYYGNIIFTNGGANPKTLHRSVLVNGNILINSGATLELDTININLFGDLTNNGTILPGESTLILNGTSKAITGPIDLHNMNVNGSYSVASGLTTFSGDLYAETTGDFNFGSNDATIDGDLTNKGTLISNGTSTFTGTRVQNIQLLNAISSTSTGAITFNGTVPPVLNSTSTPNFATVNINNTGGIIASAPWNVAVALNIDASASFDDGGLEHKFFGDFTNNGAVVSSGKLVFSPGAPYSASGTITLDGGSFVSTGEVEFAGMASLNIIDNSPVFNNVVISSLHADGVSASSSWVINNELQIESGAEFNAGAGTSHTIVNSLVNNGNLNGQTSHITFTGTDPDVGGIGTTQFYNLTIDGGSSLILNSEIYISKNLVIDGAYFGEGRKLIFSGTENSIISGASGSVTLDLLEQNKESATTTLQIPVTIAEELILTDGIIHSDATNLLVINDEAISSEGNANSFVDGPIKKIGNDAFIFPLGDFNRLAKLGISAPSNITDEFTAQYLDDPYSDVSTVSGGLYNVSDGEYWTLSRDVGSSNVSVELFWQSSDLSDISNADADLVVAHWNGSAWENSGQTAISGSGSGSVTSNLVTSFSPFTFGLLASSKNNLNEGLNTLPIELVNFEAVLMDDIVNLYWETSSELNNEYFTIERSTDGIIFDEIVQVDGAGNSETSINYLAKDYQPLSDLSYYRLKQTDFDGNYSYSSIKAIDNSSSTINFSVFPNPNNGELINIYHDSSSQNLKVEIFDIKGQLLYSGNEVSNQISIRPNPSLDKGLYFISILDKTVKLIVK